MNMSFTDVLSTLVTNCGNLSRRTIVDIGVHGKDLIMVSDENVYNYNLIHGNDSWRVFAGALGVLRNLILENCTTNHSTLVNTNSSTLSLSDNDRNGIDIETFVGGFVSGMLAAGLVVTSYCLLKKYAGKIKSSEESDKHCYTNIYNNDDDEVRDQLPSSMLENSERTSVHNKINLLL